MDLKFGTDKIFHNAINQSHLEMHGQTEFVLVLTKCLFILVVMMERWEDIDLNKNSQLIHCVEKDMFDI